MNPKELRKACDVAIAALCLGGRKMTEEQLKRGNELTNEIKELKNKLNNIEHLKGNNRITFGNGNYFQFDVPKNVVETIEVLVESSLNHALKQKQKEFEDLGKEEK